MSGSSASPMRSVVWAWTPAPNETSNTTVAANKRINFIKILSRSNACRRQCIHYTNPGDSGSFRPAAECRHKFLQRRRKGAIGGNDGLGRGQFGRAVAGGGVP